MQKVLSVKGFENLCKILLCILLLQKYLKRYLFNDLFTATYTVVELRRHHWHDAARKRPAAIRTAIATGGGTGLTMR